MWLCWYIIVAISYYKKYKPNVSNGTTFSDLNERELLCRAHFECLENCAILVEFGKLMIGGWVKVGSE